jgi:thiosulfate dehydrogenase [quinone] large subunit
MATTTGTSSHQVEARATEHRWAPLSLAVARLALGWVFLWPFLDKLFGLGKATPSERAWVNGGSPTTGFLKGVTGADSKNPFKGFFDIFVGHGWADWLFMLGLLGIGVALLAGVAMRIAAVSATLLLGMMWLASFPLDTNPFLDDHVVYALLAIVLAATAAGDYLGFGRWWKSQKVVAQNRWLE